MNMRFKQFLSLAIATALLIPTMVAITSCTNPPSRAVRDALIDDVERSVDNAHIPYGVPRTPTARHYVGLLLADENFEEAQRVQRAEFLLRQGQFERATTFLDEHFHNLSVPRHFAGEDEPPRSTQLRIGKASLYLARIYFEFQLFELAEHHARQAILSLPEEMPPSENVDDHAFGLIAEIYRQREDLERLDLLLSQLPNILANPLSWQEAAQLLTHHGRWRQAARDLEDFPGHAERSMTRALYYYRAGLREEALRDFDALLSGAGEAGGPLFEIIDFLLDRGDHDAAGRILDSLSALESEICTANSIVFLAAGDHQSGWRQYDQCRSFGRNFTTAQRARISQALVAAGHFDWATEEKHHLIDEFPRTPRSLVSRDQVWDLHLEDEVELDLTIELLLVGPLRGHSADGDTPLVFRIVLRLMEAGHYDKAMEILRRSFRLISNFRLIDPFFVWLENSESTARMAHWSVIEEQLRAALPRLRQWPTFLLGSAFGEYRMAAGQFAEALEFLGHGGTPSDGDHLLQVASLRLLTDDESGGMNLFATWLFGEDDLAAGLESLILRFDLAGRPQAADNFLEQLIGISSERSLRGRTITHQARLSTLPLALPIRMRRLLQEESDPALAIDMIRAAMEANQPPRVRSIPGQRLRELSFQEYFQAHSVNTPLGRLYADYPRISHEEATSAAFFHSLSVLIEEGFIETVETLLADEEMPELSPPDAASLDFQLALARGDSGAAALHSRQVLRALDDLDQRQAARLQMAKEARHFDSPYLARRLVEEALSAQVYFADHAHFFLYLELLVEEGRENRLPQEIDAYLSRTPNRVETRRAIIDELLRHRRYHEALPLAVASATHFPREDDLIQGLKIALQAGDTDAAVALTRRLFQVADSPLAILTEILIDDPITDDPRHLLTLVEEVRRAFPQLLDWSLQHVRLLYAVDEFSRARRLLTTILEERRYNRRAVTAAVEMLSGEALDEEIIGRLKPNMPDDILWPRLMIRFAEAEFGLHSNEGANYWLRRLDEEARRPDFWRMELADRLAIRGRFDLIEEIIAPAQDLQAPQIIYLRGLGRIIQGDGPRGIEYLRRANEGGVLLVNSHPTAIRAALHAGDRQSAQTLIDELLRLPTGEDEDGLFYLNLAMEAAAMEAAAMEGNSTLLRYPSRAPDRP